MTANATMPMNMLGKPKTELCRCLHDLAAGDPRVHIAHGDVAGILEDLELFQHQGAGREPADDAGDQQEPARTGGRGSSEATAVPQLHAPAPRWCAATSPVALEMLGMGFSPSGRVHLVRFYRRRLDEAGQTLGALPGDSFQARSGCLAYACFDGSCETMNVAGTRSTFGFRSGDFVPKTANDEQGMLRIPLIPAVPQCHWTAPGCGV